MATPVTHGHEHQIVAGSSAAAGNALTIPLTAPPPGQCTVIDWLTASFSGTIQLQGTVLIQEVVGPVTVWHSEYGTGVAGVGNDHWPFTGGFKGKRDKQLQLVHVAMANCILKLDVGYHFEIPSD